MGTSKSSTGPGAGVSLVPPWADPPPDEAQPVIGDPAADEGRSAPEPPAVDPKAAPGRFGATRSNATRFARSGDTDALRRSLSRYVTSGYGGSRTLTRRLSGTARTAGRLSSLLGSASGGDGDALRDRIIANSGNADAILNAVVEAVAPTDGTQDTEAARFSIHTALSDLLSKYPDADLAAISDTQRDFVIERYTALDVTNRFLLDVGKTIRDKAPDAVTAARRARQVREFIQQEIAAAFRAVRANGRSLDSNGVSALVRDALRETFTVFEDYTS
jgi:hypothetical protein